VNDDDFRERLKLLAGFMVALAIGMTFGASLCDRFCCSEVGVRSARCEGLILLFSCGVGLTVVYLPWWLVKRHYRSKQLYREWITRVAIILAFDEKKPSSYSLVYSDAAERKMAQRAVADGQFQWNADRTGLLAIADSAQLSHQDEGPYR
jgi:hypothetical protein